MSLQAALKDARSGKKITEPFFNQHLLIVGQTGSGKTTSALSILDQLQHENQTAIVLDPTGEYAQLPNAVTYKLGENAYLEAGKLSEVALQEVMGIKLPLAMERQLARAINSLKVQRNIAHGHGPLKKINYPADRYQRLLEQLSDWASEYQVTDLPQQLVEEMVVPFDNEHADYCLLGQQYDRQGINRQWGLLTDFRERLASQAFRELFDTVAHPGTSKTELGFVLKMFLNQRASHRTLVVDLSILKRYEQQQGAIISYLLKLILNDRLATNNGTFMPVKLVLDEAHRYLPTGDAQLAKNGIFQVLREGRKVNLQMALTTQSPLDLPARLRSQFGISLIHRLLDQDELASVALDLAFEDVAKLETGQAFLKQRSIPAKKVLVQAPQWW